MSIFRYILLCKQRYNVVSFEDPLVEDLLIQHNSTLIKGKITLYQLSQYKNISNIFYKSNITSFDEFKYFTGLTYIGGTGSKSDLVNNFNDCLQLRKITVPPNITRILYGSFSLSGIETLIIPKTVNYIQSESIISNKSLKIIIFEGDDINISSGNYFFIRNHSDLKIYIKPKVYEKFYNRFSGSNSSEQRKFLIKYENDTELPKI